MLPTCPITKRQLTKSNRQYFVKDEQGTQYIAHLIACQKAVRLGISHRLNSEQETLGFTSDWFLKTLTCYCHEPEKLLQHALVIKRDATSYCMIPFAHILNYLKNNLNCENTEDLCQKLQAFDHELRCTNYSNIKIHKHFNQKVYTINHDAGISLMQNLKQPAKNKKYGYAVTLIIN